MTAPSVSGAAAAAPLAKEVASDAATEHSPAEGLCRNCGAPASRRFCPDCGQTTAVHPPTVVHFLREFLEHHVAIEGSLWRTLSALLLTPGRLTVDYFAGRRARYIGPLRLYLTFSLLFFAFTNFTGGNHPPRLGDDAIIRIELPKQKSSSTDAASTERKSGGLAYMERLAQRIEGMTPEQRAARVNAGMRQYLPYVLIVLVPLLALYLKIVYWNRRQMYGEHLVVAFHAQTVVFIFALVSALPVPDLFIVVVAFIVVIHGFVALRRVYGGRRLATAVREFLVLGTYGVTVLAALAATATLTLAL